MAKVTITIFDKEDEPDNVGVTITFDPPIDGDSHGTPAQAEAIDILQYIADKGDVE